MKIILTSNGGAEWAYYQQDENIKNKYQPILTLKPDFFNTMISRLYIFDGSLTNSTGATLIKFTNLQIGGEPIPVISETISLSPVEAEAVFSKGITPGTDLISVQYTHPIINISALTHYRLIYESPSRIAVDEYAQLYSVKIFERVTGYRIAGSGVIEIPLITNAGRSFVYRQKSNDNAFVVPYSTKRDGNGVRALGPYRNVLTGETFEVSNEQVISNSWEGGGTNQPLNEIDRGAGLLGKVSEERINIHKSMPYSDAVIVSSSFPSTMNTSQVYPVEIKIRNTGTNTWTKETYFKLGGRDGIGDALKFGPGRFEIPSGSSVPLGNEYSFNFTVTSPSTQGNYNPQYQMLKENVEWFGDVSQNLVSIY